MNLKSHFLGAAALLAVAALATPLVQDVVLKRTPKEGTTLKYRLKAKVDVGGIEAEVEGVQQEKVLKIEADGSYTVEARQLEQKVRVAGNEVPAPSDESAEVTVFNADGTIKEIRGERTGPSSYRLANLNSFIAPAAAIKMGGSWTHEFKADEKTGAVAAKAEYTLQGEEKVGTHDTYKVKVTAKESEGSEPATNEATYWVDKASLELVKAEGKWTNAPFPGAPSAINGTYVLTLEG